MTKQTKHDVGVDVDVDFRLQMVLLGYKLLQLSRYRSDGLRAQDAFLSAPVNSVHSG